MASPKTKKYISNLHVNGMDGRMLRRPAPKNKRKEIFLLYGHHASLERLAGLAEILNKHGSILMPDLPGFGGMDSFYKIGEEPSLDNYADYLASLFKLHYKKKRKVTIMAMSFSVPLVVRMLQKYPDIAKKVEAFISISGFVRGDEFKFDKKSLIGLKTLSTLGSTRTGSWLLAHTILTKPVITTTYQLASGRHSKMKDALNRIERDRRIAFEAKLWKINDVRTRFYTMNLMFSVDLLNEKILAKVPVYNVTAADDRYFDGEVVTQHLHVIFTNVEQIPIEMTAHVPSVVATAKEAAPYVPLRVQEILG